MKRIFVFALVVVFVFAFISCSLKDPKSDVFNLVKSKYDEIIRACEDKDEQALLSINGITKVKIVDGYVIVFCQGRGISVSSQHYGFYYSEENSPITVDCNQNIVCGEEGLAPEGNGYQAIFGGNTFYTEHVKGNIYFYSNAY